MFIVGRLRDIGNVAMTISRCRRSCRSSSQISWKNYLDRFSRLSTCSEDVTGKVGYMSVEIESLYPDSSPAVIPFIAYR